MLINRNSMNLKFILVIIKLMLIISFISCNFVKFFIFFELSIIPALILIIGWGVQPERLLAGSYLMLYTFLGSMPLMISFIWLLNFEKSLKFILLKYFSSSIFFLWECSEYGWLGLLMLFGFFIKLPIYGLHLWLPKAHVEAPVVGSMILAGVLLKLGSYGLIRLVKIFHLNYINWGLLIKFWVCFSLFIIKLICFRQKDLKSLVAYSSVSHMSLIVLSISSGKILGILGVILMRIAHGICSSGLFANVKIFYFLRGSRKILFKNGFKKIFPILRLFFFFLCIINSSAPPSLNLFSEIFILISSKNFNLLKKIFFFFSIFLVGLFSIYLYILVFHGKWRKFKKNFFFLNFKYLIMLFFHVFPCFLLFFIIGKLN